MRQFKLVHFHSFGCAAYHWPTSFLLIFVAKLNSIDAHSRYSNALIFSIYVWFSWTLPFSVFDSVESKLGKAEERKKYMVYERSSKICFPHIHFYVKRGFERYYGTPFCDNFAWKYPIRNSKIITVHYPVQLPTLGSCELAAYSILSDFLDQLVLKLLRPSP